MVVDGDKTSRADRGAHGACGIGGRQHGNAELFHESHGQAHRACIAGFVVMCAALEQENALALKRTGDELARMA